MSRFITIIAVGFIFYGMYLLLIVIGLEKYSGTITALREFRKETQRIEQRNRENVILLKQDKVTPEKPNAKIIQFPTKLRLINDDTHK